MPGIPSAGTSNITNPTVAQEFNFRDLLSAVARKADEKILAKWLRQLC
jgi:hypothetical protein